MQLCAILSESLHDDCRQSGCKNIEVNLTFASRWWKSCLKTARNSRSILFPPVGTTFLVPFACSPNLLSVMLEQGMMVPPKPTTPIGTQQWTSCQHLATKQVPRFDIALDDGVNGQKSSSTRDIEKRSPKSLARCRRDAPSVPISNGPWR